MGLGAVPKSMFVMCSEVSNVETLINIFQKVCPLERCFSVMFVSHTSWAQVKETVLALTLVINEKYAVPRRDCETLRKGNLFREHKV